MRVFHHVPHHQQIKQSAPTADNFRAVPASAVPGWIPCRREATSTPRSRRKSTRQGSENRVLKSRDCRVAAKNHRAHARCSCNARQPHQFAHQRVKMIVRFGVADPVEPRPQLRGGQGRLICTRPQAVHRPRMNGNIVSGASAEGRKRLETGCRPQSRMSRTAVCRQEWQM